MRYTDYFCSKDTVFLDIRTCGHIIFVSFVLLSEKKGVSLHRNGEIRQDHQHHPGISSTRPARLVHRQRGTIVFVYSLKFIVYGLQFTVYSLQMITL